MNKKLIYILAILLLSISSLFAQIGRETRAVWVSTNFRLDWPPQTTDQNAQKEALIKIFDNIKSKNLNTIYFQVRSNGSVMFNSAFESFSPYITGKVADTPGYDPLKFAIQEAHKRGLEIHAWVNTIRCFAGKGTYLLTDPEHISNKRPGWIVKRGTNGNTEYWLDPGLPEVREYLENLFLDLVKNYNIDGLQLDFIRYPGKDFDDDFSYGVYGKGMNRDDWRRQNINDLVEELGIKIKEVKPYLKYGATPIGIYRNQNGAFGNEGFTNVYQDARDWLKNGYIDYAVPQLYWNFEDNPKFDVLADDWQRSASGRNVVLGIAAYKDEVKPEMDKMVEYSREIGASGVAFFRYSNIKDYHFNSFPHITFPATMTWLDGVLPDAPYNLTYSVNEGEPAQIKLYWDFPNVNLGRDSLSYFSIYNLDSENSKTGADNLVDLIPSSKKGVVLGLDHPKKINYYFTLKSVTKLWNESINSSNVIEVKFPQLSLLAGMNEIFDNPVLLKNKTGGADILVYVNYNETIEISGQKKSGERKIQSDKLLPGKNVISLSDDLSKYSALTIKYENSGREVKLQL